MFPDFRYLIHGLTGAWPPEWVGIFKTFGLMVALAFVAATRVMISELRRKEQAGLLQPTEGEVKGKDGQRTKVLIYPHQRIGEIVMIAAIAGLAGANIFNAFETWDQFIQDPIDSLFSRSGLTFYGGFIMATLVFVFYARKYKVPFKHLADAAAPAIMLAYGVGRLGCQLSGDGDWGIYNSAYLTRPDGKLEQVQEATFLAQSQIAPDERKTAIYAPAAAWMPQALVAQNFAHNVNREGAALADCGDPSPDADSRYCNALAAGVFPTSLYEAVAGILLFCGMWAARRRLWRPWKMFGLFLLLSGMERLLIEQVRVNSEYDLGFVQATQAEIIAVALIGAGAWLLLRRSVAQKPAAI